MSVLAGCLGRKAQVDSRSLVRVAGLTLFVAQPNRYRSTPSRNNLLTYIRIFDRAGQQASDCLLTRKSLAAGTSIGVRRSRCCARVVHITPATIVNVASVAGP
jgi:hypothetical protein